MHACDTVHHKGKCNAHDEYSIILELQTVNFPRNAVTNIPSPLTKEKN